MVRGSPRNLFVLALTLSGLSLLAGSCGSGAEPPTGPSASHAKVAIESIVAIGEREGSGYRYTVTVIARESGGVNVSVTAWEIAFSNGSTQLGVARFDQSNFGSLAQTIASHSTSLPQIFEVSDSLG